MVDSEYSSAHQNNKVPHHEQNGQIPNGDVHYSVDDHFAYFRAIYNRANENFLVQKVVPSRRLDYRTFGRLR